MTLCTNEKPQYLHTACRIAINLRSSRAAPLLQSMRFPAAPEPAATTAAISQLKEPQRFDLMAVPKAILGQRVWGADQIIIDVRFADGRTPQGSHGTTPEHPFAIMQLTLFL